MPDFNAPRLLSFLAARRKGKPEAAPEPEKKPAAKPTADRQSILKAVMAERKGESFKVKPTAGIAGARGSIDPDFMRTLTELTLLILLLCAFLGWLCYQP